MKCGRISLYKNIYVATTILKPREVAYIKPPKFNYELFDLDEYMKYIKFKVELKKQKKKRKKRRKSR